MQAKAAQRRMRWRGRRSRRRVVSPHAVPFLPQYSQCPQRQDAHTSKFVLLQPPSLFSFPLSLSLLWRSSVSPLLPLSPSLTFFSLTPPLFPAIGGLVVVFFFLKGQLDFRRQTRWSSPMSYRYISDDTHPFCNLHINYLMNHVTNLSGGVVYVCCGDGVGVVAVCAGGVIHAPLRWWDPFKPVRVRKSAVWCFKTNEQFEQRGATSVHLSVKYLSDRKSARACAVT